jgi:acyl-coenzyme A synthetase/AMP-(fatty) acid ligase
MELSEALQEVFSAQKDRPAVSRFIPPNTLATWSYNTLSQRVMKFADFLSGRGAGSGDFVVGYMQKTPEAVAALLGALFCGAVACNLNTRMKPPQLLSVCQKANPKFLVLDKVGLLNFLEIRAATDPGLQVIFMGSENELRSVAPILGKGVSKLPVHPWRNKADEEYPLVSRRVFQGERPGLCLFTSGSTGVPKGVLISRDDLSGRARIEMEDYELKETDCLLSLLPFSFDVGMNQLFASLLAGSHLVILNSYFAKDILQAVKSCGITGISGVPSIWANMIHQGEGLDSQRSMMKSLRYITVSGGDLGRDQLLLLKSYLGPVKIFKTYGQTETFRSSMLKPSDFERKITSVGRPVKGTRIFILDTHGKLAEPDQEGEIVHFGAGMMLGYLNDSAATAEKIKEAPGFLSPLIQGKVVYTGDRGKMDAEGYLTVLGRQDGMIKTWGIRVYPKEIENQVLECKGVRMAAVVGIRDPIKGQAIIAEVVADPGMEVGKLENDLRNKLPHYMIPERVLIVGGLPLTENGKIDYPKIREKYE